MTDAPDEPAFRPSRRGLLSAALGGAAGLAIGGATAAALTRADLAGTGPTPAPADAAVPVHGTHQAGIQLPASPQHFGSLLVLDTPGIDLGWLPALGERILAQRTDGGLLPDGAGDLTVTVGLGPRLVPTGLPGSTDLPAFVGDEAIEDSARGGDVLLAAYSSDPTVLDAVLADLADRVPGATVRWRQFVFRGAGSGTKARNPLGFMDGIVVPHSAAEFAAGVWISDGPAASGSILVIRRLRLDTAGFRALEVPQREAVIGRTLSDGAPLSGGGPDDQVDLRAKTAEGELLVPARSHARAAHPSFTGSPLMFRRSYSFENAGETGLVFMSFQNELRTFVVTQQRLDDGDALMAFTTPTASATFLVLPGFDAERPLGSTLV